MSEAPDVNVVYDWVDTTPMFSVEFQKETLEDGTERFKATCPNEPQIAPCYGEELVDANEAMHRRLWAYISSGRDVTVANAEKDS